MAKPLNLLELIPKRIAKWEEIEGLVVILKPKFSHPWMREHLLPRLKKPYYRVKLDETGSSVCRLCDGQRTVEEIGKILSQSFGEKIEPLYERLSYFLQMLERNRFLNLTQKDRSSGQ